MRKIAQFLPLLLLMLPVTFNGCTGHPLAPLNQSSNIVVGYGSLDAHLCTSPPNPAKQNLKYLYILDHSASNQPGFPNALTPSDVSNTDPQGSRRYGPLVNFTRNLVPDPNTPTSFGLIDFNDNASQLPVAGFDSNATDFINVVTADWINAGGGGTAARPAPSDQGFTNYSAALSKALEMIRTDAQMEAANPVQPVVQTAYVIIFVSDGIPTIATGDPANPIYTQTYDADLKVTVDRLTNLKSDPILGPLIANVTLNTAFYDNGTALTPAQQAAETQAESLLGQMADNGRGQYLRFTSGQNILYEQFAPPSRNILNQLVDIFVENENAVWWDNGTLLQDSDGDGLPDLIEVKFGSNPNKADSDGNGVSDLVEYRTKGRPCDDAKCSPAGRDLYAICAGFSPVTNPDGSITFASSTNDGLNDCEKYLLGASRSSFNSNGDLIPDEFAFKSSLQIIPGSANSAFSDPFIDGVMNYAKLKLGLPIQISMKRLNDFQGRNSNLVQEASPSPDVACYHFTVGHIALTSSSNTIKVMVVQNTSAVEDRPFLKTATGAITDEQLTLSLAPGDFK